MNKLEPDFARSLIITQQLCICCIHCIDLGSSLLHGDIFALIDGSSAMTIGDNLMC